MDNAYTKILYRATDEEMNTALPDFRRLTSGLGVKGSRIYEHVVNANLVFRIQFVPDQHHNAYRIYLEKEYDGVPPVERTIPRPLSTLFQAQSLYFDLAQLWIRSGYYYVIEDLSMQEKLGRLAIKGSELLLAEEVQPKVQRLVSDSVGRVLMYGLPYFSHVCSLRGFDYNPVYCP